MSGRQRPDPDAQFHGGDLADAVSSGGEAGADWIDLSTGINPGPYPLPDLPDDLWARLPGRTELAALLDAAAAYYDAADPTHIVAGPGSQAFIQALPSCLPDQPVTILAPTYGGLAPAWAETGREVRTCAALGDGDPASITVLVNPNNPDGRLVPVDEVLRFADRCTQAGGWLVADEAFCDLAPEQSAASHCANRNLIVLRSFGKFFGLAGLRLGFAVAPEAMVARLRRALGPWAVSSPAIRIGKVALRDTAWQAGQREALHQASARLDGLLEDRGLAVTGGTALFRLVQSPDAPRLFSHLLKHGIYVRRFEDRPDRLRFGLPGSEAAWDRLGRALEGFAP